MKKTGIILGLIIGFISCTQTKYFVISAKDLLRVDWENNILNYIPLMDNDLENSSILDSTYNLIVMRKYSKLNNYLTSIHAETSDFYLAKTLYFISKSEYLEASKNLRNISAEQFEIVKALLYVDLSYELAKQNGSKNYKKFLQDYQTVLDKYPDNESLKKIIALRTRYIRYNY